VREYLGIYSGFAENSSVLRRATWTGDFWHFEGKHCLCLRGSYIFFFDCAKALTGPRPPHYRGFTITLRHSTLGRTSLDERSTRRRDKTLTTNNTYVLGGIRTWNSSKRTAVDPRLRPRGHWSCRGQDYPKSEHTYSDKHVGVGVRNFGIFRYIELIKIKRLYVMNHLYFNYFYG
jgi:hypothetical protein